MLLSWGVTVTIVVLHGSCYVWCLCTESVCPHFGRAGRMWCGWQTPQAVLLVITLVWGGAGVGGVMLELCVRWGFFSAWWLSPPYGGESLFPSVWKRIWAGSVLFEHLFPPLLASGLLLQKCECWKNGPLFKGHFLFNSYISVYIIYVKHISISYQSACSYVLDLPVWNDTSFLDRGGPRWKNKAIQKKTKQRKKSSYLKEGKDASRRPSRENREVFSF